MVKLSEKTWVPVGLLGAMVVLGVPLVWGASQKATSMTNSIDAMAVSMDALKGEIGLARSDIKRNVSETELRVYLRLLQAKNEGVIDVPLFE